MTPLPTSIPKLKPIGCRQTNASPSVRPLLMDLPLSMIAMGFLLAADQVV
jgi:hypothetical protein